jgi:hypothetical protein
MFSRMQELKNTEDIDLLIIGASQAYRGIDTRILQEAGFSSFNLGSSNQTPLQSELLLKRYIDQLNPDKIIVVVYPEVFSVDGVESSLDLIANDNVNFSMLVLAVKQQNFKLINTFIYVAYRQIFGLNKHFKEKTQKGNDTYIKGGYVEKEISYFSPHDFENNTWQFNHSQIKAFEGSLKLIQERGIQYLLIQTPTPQVFFKSQTNNVSFDRLMHSYRNYYNYNELLELNDSLHFYDEFHMNQKGVEIFNKALLEMLVTKESQISQ